MVALVLPIGTKIPYFGGLGQCEAWWLRTGAFAATTERL